MTAQRFSDATVDEREVARFAALAAEWWDPRGRMGMLHKLNPTRLAYIRDTACRHFNRDPKVRRCLEGLRLFYQHAQEVHALSVAPPLCFHKLVRQTVA